MPTAKFKVWKSPKDKQWYFHMRARNNKITVPSQGYARLGGALRGIGSLKRDVAEAVVQIKR